MKRTISLLFVFCLAMNLFAAKQSHPCLLLTRDAAKSMKASVGQVPLFDASLEELIAQADEAVKRPVNVPVPKDGGGGYTHEVHKRNYYDMYHCGLAWQITGRQDYVDKVRELLLAYAELYPTLGYHPMTLSPVRGRLFWQTLNESVWLVHTAMAYDCVYDALSARDRRTIEKNVFYPMTSFIMAGTPDNRANEDTFNKMHNHGTWSQAAVGLIGFAMGDNHLVDAALYGSRPGGGFIRQLESLFSPDGYFTEGAYYHRYAIWPFVLFAQAIEHNRPSLHIFGYRDGIILKSVGTLLNLAYEGEFFHINDALAKGYDAQELVCAVDIAYAADPSNKQLLSIVRDYQKKVLVSDAGFMAARDVAAGQAEPLKLRSGLYRDGGDGTDGAFAVLRTDGGSALTFKATSHGLSHGHYDKLTFAWYDGGNEVVSDYGAARFVNIEAKYKGHYTPENKSYAMTTIAHNTLVVDERSHFGGKIKESSLHAPRLLAYHDSDVLQCVAAVDSCATPGVRMTRWLGVAAIPWLEGPLVIDILKANSAKAHTYDYPVHYNGHMISLSVPYQRALDSMTPLGKGPGYKHLWVEAEARGGEGSTSYTWLCGSKMYSLTTLTDSDSEIKLLRAGANDPNFNLRPEPAFLLREKNTSDHLFASCLESHGSYDLRVAETAAGMERSCLSAKVLRDDATRIEVQFDFKGGYIVVASVDPAAGKMTIKY